MAHIIYKRTKYPNDEVVGVCNNKDLKATLENLRKQYKNSPEVLESPHMKNLVEQRDALKKKISELQHSKKGFAMNLIPMELRQEINELKKIAHKEADRDIAQRQKSLAEVEKQIESLKRLAEGDPYYSRKVKVLR